MSTRSIRRVVVAAVGLALAAGPLAIGVPGASAARSATTAVDTSYLQDTLGLPTQTVVETVTYDRFQWLLQQPGQYAFLIGSPSDPGFKANAVTVDAAAKTAGAAKVYWFDPNLSGYTDTRSLDTRSPADINLATASRTAFGNTWRNLLGQYLGNGIKSVPSANRTTVTITADDTVVNDATDPAWDFRTGETPAVGASDDVFLTYDKDRTSGGAADKIADWVNLSTDADVATSTAAALAAIGGGGTIDQRSQFQWWKDAANTKHDLAYADDARYGGDILEDSDEAGGWRVQQITYPELIHLLDVKDTAGKNFVVLFGGTWCHNTRAVLKHVNQQAQENGVTTVYNLDLVLDGGTTNGTNGGTNPIHVRDNANSGATTDFRPSYLYGDLVRKYLRNLITEYDAHTGNRVSYYPNGDLTAFPDVVRKLQVPFLINYERGTGTNPSGTAIKRQWIQQDADPSTGLPTFREYMTEWWFTQPSAQLGLAFPIPADESTLTNPQQTQLQQARSNVAFAQDGLAKLDLFFGGLPGAVVADPTVTAPTAAYGKAPVVNLAIENKYGRVPAGNATLTVGGRTYTQAVAQNAASFIVAKLAPGSYPFTVAYAGDDQVVAFQRTGTLVVAKGGAPKTAGKVAKAPTSKKAGRYQVKVTGVAGLATPSGKVTVTLTKGRARKVLTGKLKKNGVVKVAVPKLAKGAWKATVGYAGDANYAAATTKGKAVKVKR